MRLKMKLSFEDKLTLPIHYNHIIQGFIYENISDRIFRKFLHDEGYKYEKRNFKLFTFSRINGKFEINSRNKTINFISPITIVVSSVLDDFINDFGSTLLKKDILFLGNTDIVLKEISAYKPEINTESVPITMLSPMVTYSTVEVYGKKKTIYHKPDDDVFDKLIYQNLLKKYESFYGKDLEKSRFHIQPLNENKTKQIITKYKEFIIKGWIGEYQLIASPEAIRFAYDTGLGSKNAQGFGCFEINK